MRRPRKTLLVYVVFLVSFAAIVSAQRNLLANPRFDSDLSEWSPLAGAAQWDPLDSDGSQFSGSAFIVGEGVGTSRTQVLVQCIPVNEGWWYELSSDVYIMQGQTDSGLGLVHLNWYSDTLCTDFVDVSQTTFATTVEEWVQVSGSAQVPPGAIAGRFALAVEKSAEADSFSANFDDAFFGPLTIFADDFESGNAEAWSATTR
ncbi:MAG: hypothetical protein GY835_18770 [bacterium]|nr:hypothetical protein [bacterium]